MSMDAPFLVECRKDAGTIEVEMPCRNWTSVKLSATHERKSKRWHSVFVKKVKGLQHDEPFYWKWDRIEQDWIPLKWYDAVSAGRKVPKGAPSLFGDDS